MDSATAAIAGLPDWVYFDRMGELIDRGDLKGVREGEDLRFDWVMAAAGSSVSPRESV